MIANNNTNQQEKINNAVCGQVTGKNKSQLTSVVIKNNEDGYLARIPGIQGAFAEGDTPQDAIFNCIDVLKIIIDYKKEQNKPLNLETIELSDDSCLTFAIPIQL
jgi:predicted RNase H-like HicB family nuclease